MSIEKMTPDRCILISGAAGGIGRELVRELSQAGVTVFAGVLNEQEAALLAADALPNVIAVPMDVSSETSVEQAVQAVAARLPSGGRLVGLVNNAGVDYNAPLQYLSPVEIRRMVEVNLLGAILLTRAALPLLRQGPSRVVLTGSAAGFMAAPIVSTYASTKFAIEGLADALRLEFRPLGIHVAVVEPGIVRTPMTAAAPQMLATMLTRMSADDRRHYEAAMRKIVELSSAQSAGIAPQQVAAAMLHALTAPRPRSRYPVGRDALGAAWLRHLPDAMRDFIQGRLFGL